MDAPSDLGSPGAAPPPHPPEGPGPRQLRRRPDDGHIAGVCAGVAEYFNVDPVLVRIAAVVLAFTGPGLIAYVLIWIFVPAEPGLASYGEPRLPIDRKDRATQIFGIVLLGLGVSVIWGDWWSPVRGWLFPLGLMALGGWLLLRPDRDDGPPPPPVPPIPPTPGSSPTAWSWPVPSATEPVTPPDTTTTIATDEPPAEGLVDPDTDSPSDTEASDEPSTDAPGGVAAGATWGLGSNLGPDTDTTTVAPTTDAGGAGYGGSPPPPAAPWDMPPSPAPGGGAPVRPPGDARPDHRHRHRHRHLVGPGVFGVLLIWAGVAWLTGVGLTTTLAVGLVILGLGFVVGSFVGGSRALVIPAILIAIALAFAAFVDIPFSGPIGEQYWSPTTRTELEDEYEVSMGEGTLDLSELGVVRVDTDVHATVGLGHLVVFVPEDQDVVVNTEVGAGSAVVFGEEQNGVGFETHKSYRGEGGTLLLQLEVGMGEIEVRRVESDAESITDDGATSTTVTLG